MKLIAHKGIILTFATILAFSCASTPKAAESNSSDTVAAKSEQTEQIIVEKLPSESELYAQKTGNTVLTIISTPKETSKGKIFTSPYIIKAETKEGTPLESFEISVSYPSSRKNGEILFSETMITTTSEGKAEFLPPNPEFAFNSEITFYPKAEIKENTEESEKSKIKELEKSASVKAPFKVQTNQNSAGGVIAVVDFNQNEKPILSNPVSCQNILMTLMKLGFIKIGNAPQDVMNAVIQNDLQKIHARAKPIAPSFIIFGTVKIDSLEKTANGITYTLTGSVKSMDSKTGEIIFVTTKTVSVTDKNDWNAQANARKQLADEIAGELKYGI